jgi:hypothetical protein
MAPLEFRFLTDVEMREIDHVPAGKIPAPAAPELVLEPDEESGPRYRAPGWSRSSGRNKMCGSCCRGCWRRKVSGRDRRRDSQRSRAGADRDNQSVGRGLRVRGKTHLNPGTPVSFSRRGQQIDLVAPVKHGRSTVLLGAMTKRGRWARPLRPRRRVPKCLRPADAPRQNRGHYKDGDPV